MKANPVNYRTQNGLLKALDKASEKPMTVKLAWWLSQANYALVNTWAWEEDEAARHIAAYHPKTSAYAATGIG